MTETAPRERPPAPTSVSAEAQAYLGATNPFARSASAPESLDDTEGWLRYIKAADDGLIKVMGQRLPADLPIERTATEIGGVPTFVFRPTSVPDEADTPIFLDIHGGALVMGGGEACAVMTTPGALGRPMITWAVDYRMPPLHRYPASLDDCITVYRALLNERPPEKIFVGGASAGGNLAAALMLRAKDEGLPMPAGLVLLSPEVDLTESGDSFATNLGIDHVLGLLINTNRLYAGGADLSHPYLSPLFGDVSGFPPTFLQTGTRDLFLSNTVRMHRKLRNAGVDAELHVWEAMPHGGLGGSPEDAEIGVEVRRFLDRLRS